MRVPAGIRSARAHTAISIVVLASVLGLAPAAAAGAGPAPASVPGRQAPAAVDAAAVHTGWAWPTPSHRVARAYVAPPHRYGAGHRGIDIVAPAGSPVTAPADGIVAFVGVVAGRPLLTVDHRGGLVSTFEPVVAAVAAGVRVRVGDELGSVDRGGHAAEGTVHFGVRRDGEYLNPLLLLGGIPHAVLLPCCG